MILKSTKINIIADEKKKYDLRMFEDGSMLIEQKVKGKLSCIFDKLVSLFIDWILRPKSVFVKTLGNAVSFFSEHSSSGG